MPRKFTYDAWDYDMDGIAYIIARDQCPNREDVPAWIVETDKLDPECLNPAHVSYLSVDDVKPAWCKYQVRSDWYNDYGDNVPRGGYVVKHDERETLRTDGRRKPGWFPVWVVRIGEWY